MDLKNVLTVVAKNIKKKNLKIVFTFSIVALLYNIYFRESTKASGFIPQPALK